MHCTLAQRTLAAGLAMTRRIVKSNHTSRILHHLLLTVETDGRVRLSATDHEVGLHYWFQADTVSETGTVLLPAKLLTDLVSELPGETVTLATTADGLACQIQCGRMRAQVRCAPDDPAEFPELATREQGGERILLIEADLLREILDQVLFAAARDASRPVLTGLLLTIEQGQALWATADSFRLATRSIPMPDPRVRQRLIIPATSLAELARMLSPGEMVQVVLSADHHQLLFHTPTLDFSTRLLEGSYPNVHTVIPTETTTRVTVATQDLLMALRSLLPLARENKQHMELILPDGPDPLEDQQAPVLTLRVVVPDVGENEYQLSVRAGQGFGFPFALNLNYLWDVVSRIATETVTLECTSPNSPIVVRPMGILQSLHVLMPMSMPVRSQEGTQEDRAAA